MCNFCCKFGLRLVTQFPRSYIRSILQMSIFFIKLCFKVDLTHFFIKNLAQLIILLYLCSRI